MRHYFCSLVESLGKRVFSNSCLQYFYIIYIYISVYGPGFMTYRYGRGVLLYFRIHKLNFPF